MRDISDTSVLLEKMFSKRKKQGLLFFALNILLRVELNLAFESKTLKKYLAYQLEAYSMY